MTKQKGEADFIQLRLLTLPVLDDFRNWLMRLGDSESPLITDIDRQMPWARDIGPRRK